MVKEFKAEVTRLKKQKKPDFNRDNIQTTCRVDVAPSYLKQFSNILNWKDHPERQMEYLADSIMNNVGWAGAALFCANTERLLNGHGRVKMGCDNKLQSMPCDIGWYTKDQGDEILASLDPSGQMASIDGNALKSLSESVISNRMKSKKSPFLSMLRDVHGHAKSVAEDKKKKIGIQKSRRSLNAIIGGKTKVSANNKETGTDNDVLYDRVVREDLIFPSKSNSFGIPDLLESKLYDNLDLLPVNTYDKSGNSLQHDHYYCHGSRPFDSQHHLKPEGGFLGFYCEDKYFEKYYREPARWLNALHDEKWYALIEPDYSTYWDWPLAKRIWSVYRSRWVCRFWQEHGIPVIPILRRTEDIEQDQWLYSSLPEKTPVAAMQLRMGGKKNTSNPKYWNGVGAVLDYAVNNLGLEHVLFHSEESYLKYVLGKIPNGLKYTFVTPYITKRRDIINARKRNK